MTIRFDITDRFAQVLRCIWKPSTTLEEIKELIEQIMSNQEAFNAQIARANTALDNLGVQIAAEAQQIRDYIAEHPDTDTSALENVVARLESVNVSGIFEPPVTEPEPGPPNPGEEEPTPEPEPEPTPEG